MSVQNLDALKGKSKLVRSCAHPDARKWNICDPTGSSSGTPAPSTPRINGYSPVRGPFRAARAVSWVF